MSSPYNRLAIRLPYTPPPVDTTLVHEKPSEDIQGGIAGEHYHLSVEQHTALLALLQADLRVPIYEPLMAQGELVTLLNGDCIMQWGGTYAA